MNFEVGKKVICVKTHSQGYIKKGQVFELQGISKQPCKCKAIMLDIGFPKMSDVQKCKVCSDMWHNRTGHCFFNSQLFAPYDDSLSDYTIESILEEVEHELITI